MLYILYFRLMILVTGGTGLVGSHLLYELTKSEDRIRAICRNWSNTELTQKVFDRFSAPREQFDKIEWMEADINDIPALETAFKNITRVYHAAAMISMNPADYRKLRKVNIEGTANIVNLCLAHKIKKLAYVSSVATLGKPIDGGEIDEESHWNSESENNMYAITKYGAEMEVWRGAQEGLSTVIVNPGVITGPDLFKSGSGAMIDAVKNGLRYYSAGGTGFVSVENVVKKMIRLMNSDVQSERFIMVDENLSYREILERIAREYNMPPPSKELKKWQIQLLCGLDRIWSVLGGKRRFAGLSAKTLNNRTYYSSEKLERLLGATEQA